jgi:hypothetical protein
MFTKEDLLARLQNGDTAEDLADEFIAAMNEAEDAYKVENEAAEKVAKLEAEKLADAEQVAEDIHNFFLKWYPDHAQDGAPLTGEMVISLLESAIETKAMMNKVLHDISFDDTFSYTNPFKIFTC